MPPLADKLPPPATLVTGREAVRNNGVSVGKSVTRGLLVLALAVFSVAAWGQDSVRGRAANPHGRLAIPCENCHTTTAWKPIRKQLEFNHTAQTGFPLRGLHQGVDCKSCHVDLVFSKAPTQCAECHADLHRRQFGSNCEQCHTVQGWNVRVSAMRDHNNRFPLLGAHAAVNCENCHRGAATGVYTGLSTECVNCHLRDYQTATPLNHVAANLPTTCDTCHGMTAWQGARFNHAQFTSFALTGAHASLQCTQCHVRNRFAGTPTACFGCHATDFTGTQNPNHTAAAFPQDCSLCHTTLTWAGASFNHNTLTSFALTGAHASVTCVQCHVGNRFAGTPTVCSGCHLQDYANTANPSHRAANFPTTCETCHTTASWQNATFDHNLGPFPLSGAHLTVACAQCHLNGNFTTAPTACVGCHLTDYQKTNAPNHVSAAFPQDCTLCHTTANWTSATFNHSTTGFSLTGAHTNLQCAQCHVNNNFSLTSAACINCHLNDYNTVSRPNHKAAGFPQDCSVCHTTASWAGATFNHSTTGFTLTGTHTTLECAQCHTNNNFSLTSTACINCHLTDYNGTNDPPHKSANFPQDCSGCHSTTNWLGATFNHSSTGFTLTGSHTALQCAQCHVGGNYNLTSGACINCHLTDYNGTNDPPHKSANFPQDCTGCHTTVNWLGATFNHASTGFALTGSHTALQCAQCHVGGNYNLTSGACVNCHLTDYNGASNPPHQAAGFPQDCTLCHNTTNWTSATFNHATTGFALTGSHTALQCAQCHVNNNYSLTSAACINCHLTDYNGTNNPPHKAANFSQDCSGCHTTTDWSGATFNHTTTGFALVGLHASQQCNACHLNNNYNLTSAACWNCHQTDYNTTNNPPHQAAGFPQDCTLCHGSTALNWTSATFNHSTTGFTLVGAHTALQCAQCHVSNNYSLTSAACWNCHQTDYNGANNPPHKSSNFPQDCTQCHTNMTDWSGATFNHTSTGFALVGLHASQQCNACHVNNNYNLTSAACWNCHQTDYNGTNNPPHQAAGFPQDCTVCHGAAALNWTSATFNHATTGFTLTGAHTSLQCNLCHVSNNYSLTSAACWNCHQTDYNGTNNPPHASSGFPQDCSGCHTTTDWTGATFNHTTTGFTLTGAHTSLQCNQCHTNNNFSLTSAACWNCHQTDYNGTNSPAHQAAGFPQDCSLCHSTTNWSGATFAHPTTPLQLTGYHATMLTNNQCGSCHVGNNYTSTPSDCWSCHQTDYNNTTNPGHAAAGFAQTCNSCHTFVDWTGAQYTAHDGAYFPIYSGTHKGKWTQCSDCHTDASNYAVFTCIACHQHSNQTQVAQDHQGVKNYVYNGTSCYTCHPKGSGG